MKFMHFVRPLYFVIFTPEVKKPKREANHWPPFGSEVKNT